VAQTGILNQQREPVAVRAHGVGGTSFTFIFLYSVFHQFREAICELCYVQKK
jgi:hypothetical protein